MSNKRCLLFAAELCFLAYATPLLATERMPITGKALGDMVQNLQVVLEGTITRVEVKYIESWKIMGGKYQDKLKRPQIVTEITMHVDDVIAGDYPEPEIRFLIREGEIDHLHAGDADYSLMKINPGETALLAINPNALGTGESILFNRSQFLRIEGGTLKPYQREYYVAVDDPWKVIATKAKARQPKAICDAAELICTATVKELINPRGADRKIVVSPDEILKGTKTDREITVEVSDIYQPFRRQRPGYRVLLFLRRDGSVYRTVGGINGYYVIDGKALKRGHNMPFWIDLDQMRNNIRIWKGGGR